MLTNGMHPNIVGFMNKASILNAIDTFASVKGIAPSVVCLRAVNEGKFYKRLKEGGTCTMETAEKVLKYIADNSSIDVDALIAAEQHNY
jgi:hypothetical protein